MKSKFKGNGKNRILAVIASAVMFCLVVLLVIVTRKTDAVADTSAVSYTHLTLPTIRLV